MLDGDVPGPTHRLNASPIIVIQDRQIATAELAWRGILTGPAEQRAWWRTGDSFNGPHPWLLQLKIEAHVDHSFADQNIRILNCFAFWYFEILYAWNAIHQDHSDPC